SARVRHGAFLRRTCSSRRVTTVSPIGTCSIRSRRDESSRWCASCSPLPPVSAPFPRRRNDRRPRTDPAGTASPATLRSPVVTVDNLMLRSALLYLSDQPRVFKFVRNNRLARRFAHRFVAGETLDEALAAVRTLNARKIRASLDLLGESVTNDREARAARDAYVEMLDHIHAQQLDANVSVKLTAMGLDISEELCISLM